MFESNVVEITKMADIADSIGSCLGITDDGGSSNGFGKKLFVGLKKKISHFASWNGDYDHL